VTEVERAFRGVPAAAGVAVAPWISISRPSLPTPGRIVPDDIPAETDRIQAASEAAARDLHALSAEVRDAGHEAEAAIFAAQAEMARDPALIEGALAEMTTSGIDAVGAVTAASRSIANMLASLGDELLAGRATDVLDVGDRIARRLAGLPDDAGLSAPAIVVGDDLAPSMTATLPRDLLRGIVLAGSSPTAHAAILARAYGIPAIVGAGAAVAAIRGTASGTTLAVDGATGEVVIDPDEADRRRFEEAAATVMAARDRDHQEARLPAVTTDGVSVTLLANIGSALEADGAVALGARGVGLFRTEFLFLERATPPSEDEQVAAYTAAVEAFGGDPVTIRLLDIGGDKPIPYLAIAPEDNPFLGVRALRLASSRPDLFLTQLRACYRASVAGSVKVMAPMVADAGDVTDFLELAARARAEAIASGHQVGDLALGVMLEIPSAVLTLGAYVSRIAFASIGTNDLLQYTLAVDRGNPELERYRDALHPAVLSLIRSAVTAADAAGIELSVCGEMAGDETGALVLVGLGVRTLSMSAQSLPAVRRVIREASSDDLRRHASAALGEGSAPEARQRFGPGSG
jgi:phosphoenolpyruvate-protein phosphotransferase